MPEILDRPLDAAHLKALGFARTRVRGPVPAEVWTLELPVHVGACVRVRLVVEPAGPGVWRFYDDAGTHPNLVRSRGELTAAVFRAGYFTGGAWALGRLAPAAAEV